MNTSRLVAIATIPSYVYMYSNRSESYLPSRARATARHPNTVSNLNIIPACIVYGHFRYCFQCSIRYKTKNCDPCQHNTTAYCVTMTWYKPQIAYLLFKRSVGVEDDGWYVQSIRRLFLSNLSTNRRPRTAQKPGVYFAARSQQLKPSDRSVRWWIFGQGSRFFAFVSSVPSYRLSSNEPLMMGGCDRVIIVRNGDLRGCPKAGRWIILTERMHTTLVLLPWWNVKTKYR